MPSNVVSEASPPPSLLRRMRKRIGFAKYVLLDGGHRNVRYAWKIDRMSRRASRMLDVMVSKGQVKPLDIPAKSEIEMHTMCGHGQVTMGIWALFSILRYAEGKIALTIHSDGSITPADVARLEQFFPNVRISQPGEARQWAEKRFAGSRYDYLRSLRFNHYLGAKTTDTHMSEHAKVVVMMDTDILFFRRPVEVFEQIAKVTQDHRVTSFGDLSDWIGTFAKKEDVEAACGSEVRSRFNFGMVVFPRFDDREFGMLERILRSFRPEWRAHYFADQLCLSVLVAELGWNELPLHLYQLGSDPEAPDPTSVHYISDRKVRPRFFLEGLPRVIRSLQEEAAH